jgi:glutamate racemase
MERAHCITHQRRRHRRHRGLKLKLKNGRRCATAAALPVRLKSIMTALTSLTHLANPANPANLAHSANSAPTPDAPIGVFDSGVGGLSVLRHIRALLPHEHLIYFADSAFSPYGNKSEAFVTERALDITRFLLERGAKAIVVACNTATITSIKALRARYPNLPIVGVEPGLKPAAALSKNGKVGVLATERTLAGDKFLALRTAISAASGAQFLLQGCNGLADQIELGELDSAATTLLLERYIHPLLSEGIDTLVLGCTHYPFVQPEIERIIARHGARPVTVDRTGAAVARQLARLLAAAGELRQHPPSQPGLHDEPRLEGYASANPALLKNAFSTLLGLHPRIEQIAIPDVSKNIS